MEKDYTLTLNGNDYEVQRCIGGLHDSSNISTRELSMLRAEAYKGGAVLLELLGDAKAEKERADRLQEELLVLNQLLQCEPTPDKQALTTLKEQIKAGPLMTFANGLTVNANHIISVKPDGFGTSISTKESVIRVDVPCTEVTQRWRAALYVEPLMISQTVPGGVVCYG